MNKSKLWIIFIAAIVLTAGGYLFFRYHVLRTKDIKPDTSRERSLLDLRPAIIAKLRQLVKDGSDGLYSLQVKNIEPDVAGERIGAGGLLLVPDSIRLMQLEQDHRAPDAVFRISLDTLRISGIDIMAFLMHKTVQIDSLFFGNPSVHVYRYLHSYNAAQRKRNDSLTLYQRITSQIKSISVHAIVVAHGTLGTKDRGNRETIWNDVSAHLNDVLIDSSTQHDSHRLYYAKQVAFACGPLLFRTPDSLYFLKMDSLHIGATEKMMTAYRVALTPRGTLEQFEKKLKTRNDRFDISVLKLMVSNVDWAALMDRKNLLCDAVTLSGGHLYDYIDDAVPSSPTINYADFPDQQLMKIGLKMHIKKVKFEHLDLRYDEKSAKRDAVGKLFFDDLTGTITNVTNIPSHISPGMISTIDADALFMHQAKVHGSFKFDLSKTNTGDFTADFHFGGMEGSIINQVAEPLGGFSISGNIHEATAHISGNNEKATGAVEFLYDGIRLLPLARAKNEEGDFKKRPVFDFIANSLVIKHTNTHRHPHITIRRDHHTTYFNFLWKAMQVDLMKTLGIPTRYAFVK